MLVEKSVASGPCFSASNLGQLADASMKQFTHMSIHPPARDCPTGGAGMPTSRSERLREMARTLAATGEHEDSAAVARRMDMDGHPDAIALFIDAAFTREIDRVCRISRKKSQA
jgi:hypothetical protein